MVFFPIILLFPFLFIASCALPNPQGFTFPVIRSIGDGNTLHSQPSVLNKKLSITQHDSSSPPNNSTLRTQLTTLGQRYGQFYAVMKLGTPPTEIALTIDTGSEFIWVQCQPCQVCSNQTLDPIFDPRISSTYRQVGCNSAWCQGEANDNGVALSCSSNNACAFNASYLDGSYSVGTVSQDTLTINNNQGKAVTKPDFVFGCGFTNLGLVASLNASGLMGLDRAKFSAPSQFQAQKFAYCLPDRSKDAHARGYITFGEQSYTFNSKHPLSFQYTNLIQNPVKPLDQLYYVHLTGISVGKSLLPIPDSLFQLNTTSGQGGTIVDSGTGVTRFVGSAYTRFRDAFRRQVIGGVQIQLESGDNQALGIDTCFIGKPDYVPEVTLHFEGSVDLTLPQDNVLLFVQSSEDIYCLAFGQSPVDVNILGSFQQQNVLVEINMNTSRVGFASTDCSQAPPPHSLSLYLLVLISFLVLHAMN